MREVGAHFRDGKSHSIQLAELVKARVDTADDAYSQRLDDYLKKGLASAYARQAMMSGGRNSITSPQDCPAWLCCILPCLNNTPKMKRYMECVAEEALINRGGRQMRIDADSLVVGDVVTVTAGEVVPADMRVFEGQGEADRSNLAPNLRKPLGVGAAVPKDGVPALDATNMCYAGFRLTAGQIRGIVVATGENTLVSRLVTAGHF